MAATVSTAMSAKRSSPVASHHWRVITDFVPSVSSTKASCRSPRVNTNAEAPREASTAAPPRSARSGEVARATPGTARTRTPRRRLPIREQIRSTVPHRNSAKERPMGQQEYPAGAPSWVDVTSPDVDASVAFYGDLFGGEAVSNGPDEETGGYRMFRRDGLDVAGIGPTQAGAPPSWTVYVAVDDADATAKAVEAAGGAVILPPLDIPQGAGGLVLLARDP